MPQFLTTGEAARRLGLRPWMVRKLHERGLISEPARLGSARIIDVDDLPAIELAARLAGYLDSSTAYPAA